MNPKRIALIGCGGLGREIATRIQSGDAGNYILCGIHTDRRELTNTCSKEFRCTAYHSKEMLLKSQPDFIIEAAGSTALKEILESAIKQHIIVIPLSIGVFSESEYWKYIQKLAAEHRTHVYLPSGAIGGFDLMGAAALDGDLSVSIHTEKPPKSLADAPFLKDQALPDDRSNLIFSGNAVEAIKNFPKNVNVAVAVGLATIGADKLSVTITSNPKLNANRHTIELDGTFGHADIQISAKPSSNVQSSRLAAYSVISLLQRLDSWIGFI